MRTINNLQNLRTMIEFRIPVAMKVTEEQYKEDLEGPLLNLGYRMTNSLFPIEKSSYLITQFANINEGIGFNQAPGSVKGEKRYTIDEYNPELFLAIAAVTHGNQFIIGEWILDTDLRGKLFQVKEHGIYNNIYAGKINNLNLPPTYKKPWLHQLVEYFNNSSQPGEYKLPERWYLRINEENFDLVNSWRVSLVFPHLPKFYTWYCITEEGIAWLEKNEDKREEITTEIFKKYIFNYESKLQIKTNKNEQQNNNNNEEQINANLDSNSRSKGGKEIRDRIKSSRIICERRSIRRREKGIRARS